jgi:hypothetical protein
MVETRSIDRRHAFANVRRVLSASLTALQRVAFILLSL